jgi:hypothetical protein
VVLTIQVDVGVLGIVASRMIAQRVGTVAPLGALSNLPALGFWGTLGSAGVTAGLTFVAVTTAFEVGVVAGAAVGALYDVYGPSD